MTNNHERYSDEKVIEVLRDCINNNLTAAEAEEKHKVSCTTVSVWAKKMNVKLKRNNRTSHNWDFIKGEL